MKLQIISCNVRGVDDSNKNKIIKFVIINDTLSSIFQSSKGLR